MINAICCFIWSGSVFVNRNESYFVLKHLLDDKANSIYKNQTETIFQLVGFIFVLSMDKKVVKYDTMAKIIITGGNGPHSERNRCNKSNY